MNAKVSLFSLLLCVGAVAAVIPGPGLADGRERKTQVIEFDVAEDATRFVFDEAPVFDDGLPAYGNQFVTQGYIYPKGTLNGGNGLFDNGDPEFPDLIIGEWTCRGIFIGDGAKTVTGPIVITTQFYDLGGEHQLVSEGLELIDVGVPIKRAITGSTVPFKNASGEAVQKLLGFNVTEGVNLRFKLKVDHFRADLL